MNTAEIDSRRTERACGPGVDAAPDCRAWCILQASEVGSAHLSNGTALQDAHMSREVVGRNGAQVLVVVVSDGAGTASHGDQGASHACQFFVDKLCHFVESTEAMDLLGRPQVELWINEFQAEIEAIAAASGGEIRDFACTLVAAAVGSCQSVFLQVGDGVIVVADDEEANSYAWQFWPDRGSYANETSFVTDGNAFTALQFEVTRRRVDQLAVMTDGLQTLALNYADRTAHSPFFRPIFAAIGASWHPGLHVGMTADMSAFLTSKLVRSRTDDDLTLVLASRAPYERVEETSTSTP